MGPFNSLFCPGGGFLYTMIVLGERVFAPFESCPGGLSQGMVLDEIDSCISPSSATVHLWREMDCPRGWFWMKLIAALVPQALQLIVERDKHWSDHSPPFPFSFLCLRLSHNSLLVM